MLAFGTHLVRTGIISPVQFVEAVELHLASRPPIGELALLHRRLSIRQVFAVLSEQAERNQTFGKLAIQLGFLDERELAWLLMVQADSTHPLDQILVEMGVLDQESAARLLAEYYRDLNYREPPGPEQPRTGQPRDVAAENCGN